MYPCTYVYGGGDGSEDGDELRVDPADGQAYNFSSFVEVYGSFAEQHWSAAIESSSGDAAVPQGCGAAMDESR